MTSSARVTLAVSAAVVPKAIAGTSHDSNVDLRRERREDRALSTLAGVAMLLFAMALLPATPGPGDGPEFTLALALGGAPHPTGYPLYVLLGYPFVHALHAVGLPWAAAANAWSALAAAVAIGLVARLGLDLARSTARGTAAATNAVTIRLAALAPAILLALNPVWLMNATQAEVYAFWYALTAAAALFALREARRLSEPRVVVARGPLRRDADARGAAGWGLIAGASLAHHALSVLVLAPLSVLLTLTARRHGRLRPALAVAALAGLALPLGAYAFIAWRAFHPAAYQWPIDPSWAGVWRHVDGSLYTRFLGGFAPKGLQVGLIRAGVLPFLVALPFAAWWALRAGPVPVRQWLQAMLVGSVVLATFVFRYGVNDPAAYFGPVILFAALVATPALLWLKRRARAAAVPALAIAALAFGAVSIPQALNHRAELDAIDARVRAGWKRIPFERGIVIWLDDYATRLEILRTLEARRPELYVVNPNLLTWPANRIRFMRRFGFDPMEGISGNYWAQLPGHLRRRTGLPVVDFRDVMEGRVPPSATR